MTKKLFRFEEDTAVVAEVLLAYHEYKTKPTVMQLKNYKNNPPELSQLNKYELHKYGIKIRSGQYLVGGKVLSNKHRVVTCDYYEDVFREYHEGSNLMAKGSSDKKARKVEASDLIALSELAACLSIDYMLGLKFEDQVFDMVTSSIRNPRKSRFKDNDTTELSMSFLLRKSDEAAVRPAHIVTAASQLVLPLDTLDKDTFTDGKHYDAQSVNFCRGNKLLRVSIQSAHAWRPA